MYLVGVWCLGEYGDQLVALPSSGDVPPVTAADILNLFEQISTSVHSTTLTKNYLLTALLKLSVFIFNYMGTNLV